MLSHVLKTKESQTSLSSTISQAPTQQWPSMISDMIIGDYLIVPLRTAKMLKSEAYNMNNNSDQFIPGCTTNENCAFSIRNHFGFSQATLILSYDDEGWRLEKCYGPSNTNVLEEVLEFFDENDIAQTEYYPTDLYYVAYEIIRLMNSQQRVH